MIWDNHNMMKIVEDHEWNIMEKCIYETWKIIAYNAKGK